MYATMFPPSDSPCPSDGTSVNNQQADGPIADQLARCVRVLPQHLDSSGFFVALFRKDTPLAYHKPPSHCLPAGAGARSSTEGTPAAPKV